MSRSRTVRPHLALAALVTAVVLTLAGALTGAAAAAETPNGPTGWIRVGHLSPDTPKATVTLTPFQGGQTTTLTEASFGDLSSYERVPVGLYTVSLSAADQAGAQPMLSRNVEITESGARTVIATGEGDDVRATVLDDDLTPPPSGQAKVRLISAANQPEAVSAEVVGGPTLATDLSSGSSTGYADVPAQEWRVRLSAADSAGDGAESAVTVRPGAVYSLVALDAPGGGLELRAVRDGAGSNAADGAMPTGGVDAGGGGLADQHHDDQAGTPVLPLAAVGALLVTAGAVVVRRRATA